MISLRIATVLGFVALTGCGPGKSMTSDTSDSNTSDTSTDTADTSDTAGPDPCLLEPDPGGCEAAFPKWAFDPQSGECYEWYYGGCDGLIPFETLESCQSMCEPCELFSSGTKPTPMESPAAIQVRNNTSEGVWLQSFQPHNDIVGFRLQVVQITPAGAQEQLITVPNECDELYDVTSSDPDSCPMNCT
ncbi:MAG: BPTI/Kunitz domain-containing protein, partial [Nannocystaceae bacterium]